MKREKLLWLAAMLVASIALVRSLWVVPYIPMQDGPQHILAAHIENHYGDAGSIYPEFYRLLPQFAGKGFALIYGPLERFLPWRTALHVTLSIIGLGFAWGFALVVLAIDAEKRAVSLLGFVIALSWSLYMGFFAFAIGTTLGLYTLAFALWKPPNTNARTAILAALLLLQAVSHVFTAVLSGLMVATLLVATAPKEKRLRELARAAIVGAPAALVLALTFVGRDMQSSSQQAIEAGSYSERLTELSRWFAPGPGLRAWLVIALMVFGIASALVRARRGGGTPAEKALAWLALAFLGLALFAPMHIPGWQFVAPRLAVLAAVLGLAIVRVPAQVPAQLERALVPVVTLLCVVSSLLSGSLHRELANGCADALSGLDAPLHFKGPRLPIVLDSFCGLPRDVGESAIPHAAMAHDTPLLYLVDHGGIAPRLFHGSASVHSVDLRRGSRMPPPFDPSMQEIAQSHWMATEPKLRTSVITELAADGMPFEGIHVVGGRPDDVAIYQARGYVTEHAQGSLFIGRFEGCPTELLLPAGALDREPVYYEYGLFTPVGVTPEPRTAVMQLIDRTTPPIGTAIHVPLKGRPCGELWLRVVWDADNSGTLSAGDRTCKSAIRDGRILATVSAERPSVRCAPGAL